MNEIRRRTKERYEGEESSLVYHSFDRGGEHSHRQFGKVDSEERVTQNDHPPEEELKHTNKKVPKISTKFPSAFGNAFPKPSNQRKFEPPLNGNRQTNQSSAAAHQQQQQIDHLTRLLMKQEFKAVQGMLSPIKMSERRVSLAEEGSHNLRNLSVERSNEEHNNVSNRKKNFDKIIKNIDKFSKGKNPILPLKKYLLLSKISDDAPLNVHSHMLDPNLEEAVQKLVSNQSSGNIKFLINSSIKLEEMITLALIKSSRVTGAVKKMLHAPTLKLYAMKEEPVSSREIRKNLREWITSWQNSLHGHPNFVRICTTFWNSPEGCVSILTDLLTGGSLQNLLESVGSLSERVISQIASQILPALDFIHTKANMTHGALTPSQILFDRNGTVKISPGLSYRTLEANNILNSLLHVDHLSLYEQSLLSTPILWQKYKSFMTNKENRGIEGEDKQSADAKPDQTVDLGKARDIFDFGYMLLMSAIGGLGILEYGEIDPFKMKSFTEEMQAKIAANTPNRPCCLIHYEDFFARITTSSLTTVSTQITRHNSFSHGSSNNQSNHTQKTFSITSKSKFFKVTVHDLLIKSGKFSEDFVNFLCRCLRFDTRERPNASSLLKHPWLGQRQDFKGPDVSLEELLQISLYWSRHGNQLPSEYQAASEKQLEKICEGLGVVLQSCEKWFTIGTINQNVQQLLKGPSGVKKIEAIDEIAADLGLSRETVYQDIHQVFNTLPFNMSELLQANGRDKEEVP
eukprot:TRINITY_DN7499_c0_g3_i1.p1 TRINITY_DN7499_c0_g3~~TRINITY_DN7499_c0_g3_i1.p1  ORF type:complete len:743 (+),score=107.15 TRINITY_DN7499_c0_g3_i1:42-2270(+)